MAETRRSSPDFARALALAAIRETFEETGSRSASADCGAPEDPPEGAWTRFAATGVYRRRSTASISLARAITPPGRPQALRRALLRRRRVARSPIARPASSTPRPNSSNSSGRRSTRRCELDIAADHPRGARRSRRGGASGHGPRAAAPVLSPAARPGLARRIVKSGGDGLALRRREPGGERRSTRRDRPGRCAGCDQSAPWRFRRVRQGRRRRLRATQPTSSSKAASASTRSRRSSSKRAISPAINARHWRAWRRASDAACGSSSRNR